MLEMHQIKEISESSPMEGLRLVSSFFPQGVVFSTSLGQEDQVLTDMVCKENLPINIFTLDTGRLFPEHYTLLANNQARYKRKIHVYFPDQTQTEDYVNTHGINGFYHSLENRKRCCYIRKVEPLNRALKGAKVWITGLRSEQSESREQLSVIEYDEQKQLYKYNPLLHWSYQEVLDYLKQQNVQELSLHSKGYISVGCQPCTRPIVEGENPRAGRWWWEESHKECGLHSN